MHYETVIAENYEQARIEAIQKFGHDITHLSNSPIETKGAFKWFRKPKRKFIFSMSDEVYMQSFKRNLGITPAKQAAARNVQFGESQGKTNFSKISPKNELIVESKQPPQNNEMMQMLQEIKTQISSAQGKTPEMPKHIEEVMSILADNEFSQTYIENMIKRIKTDLSLSVLDSREELHKEVFNFIREDLESIIESPDIIYSKDKNAMVLVGPTGIGKTTTIAKIAANVFKERKEKAELLTIDGFRIGAKKQLEIYAEHLDVNIHYPEKREDIERVISLSTSSLFLIDTIGRSQKDELKLFEMKSILDIRVMQPLYVLAISATTNPKQVVKIFKNFELFNYTHVIITKTDEADSIGSILSMAMELNKKVLFLTTGQRVPSDIENSSVHSFLEKIKGFDVGVYFRELSQ